MKNLSHILLIVNVLLALGFAAALCFRSTRRRAIRFWKWFAISWGVLLFCSASCNPNEVLGEAATILAGLPGIIAAAGALIPGPIGATITSVGALISAAITQVQKAEAQYQANPSDTTLAALQTATNNAHVQILAMPDPSTIPDPVTANKVKGIVATATAAVSAVEGRTIAKHADTVAAASQSSS
jgi:hypothetical protein